MPIISDISFKKVVDDAQEYFSRFLTFVIPKSKTLLAFILFLTSNL